MKVANARLKFSSTPEFAKELDKNDPLASYRNDFWIPPHSDGQPSV